MPEAPLSCPGPLAAAIADGSLALSAPARQMHVGGWPMGRGTHGEASFFVEREQSGLVELERVRRCTRMSPQDEWSQRPRDGLRGTAACICQGSDGRTYALTQAQGRIVVQPGTLSGGETVPEGHPAFALLAALVVRAGERGAGEAADRFSAALREPVGRRRS